MQFVIFAKLGFAMEKNVSKVMHVLVLFEILCVLNAREEFGNMEVVFISVHSVIIFYVSSFPFFKKNVSK